MSIFKTAYDTAACRGYITDKVMDGLTRADIKGLLTSSKLNDVVLVIGGHLVDELVPTFNHPILFKDKNGIDKLAIDVRGYGKWDSVQQEYVVRDTASYDGLMVRAGLNEIWLEPNGPDRIRSLSVFPLSVFASWIGEAVAKRLALEAQDQFTVSVLAAIFYLNLFWDNERSTNPTKMDKAFLVSVISRGLNYKSDMVYDIVEKHAGIIDVNAYCEACKSYSQSVRLRDLNASTLFAMIGGYWYGSSGREVIAVALEHPPTWLSLLWQAMYIQGYRNAGLTKILERSTYKRQSSQFGLAVSSLLKTN
jgi:hypothetical protein